eukprot:TRINITY_DN24580_c0_g1_i1.p1 TRINITY_DN24580_c0_g1~~TRINITY_DN24580_c0_g1_i1.p1  ORF type:complete len:161 (-),score=19.37 TRINITY_DN24580_c0_g1_i1:18-500(-)
MVYIQIGCVFLLMIRRPPRSTHCISSAASDVYKRQINAEYMGTHFFKQTDRATRLHMRVAFFMPFILYRLSKVNCQFPDKLTYLYELETLNPSNHTYHEPNCLKTQFYQQIELNNYSRYSLIKQELSYLPRYEKHNRYSDNYNRLVELQFAQGRFISSIS